MSLKEKVKKFLSLFLRVGLSVALLWYLFSRNDMGSITELLKTANHTYILGAGLLFLLLHAILLIRWWILIKALQLKIPLKVVVSYFFIGLFFNLFLPSATGGDVIKTFGLCKFVPQHKAKVVASVVLDRVSGFIAIVLVAFVSFLVGQQLLNDPKLLLAICLLGVISATIVLILFNETIFSFGCRLFSRFPRLKNGLMKMHYDIALLKDKRSAIIWAIGWSCLAQFILSFDFYLISLALRQNIAFVYFLIFVPIICVVSTLPSIGGLGVRDYGAAQLFSRIGVASSVAVSMTLINFFFMVATGLIGGIIYVAQLSSRRLQHHPQG